MGKEVRDVNGELGEFTITNWVEDLSMDCNTGTLGVVADTLGTLIKILDEKGIISATVTA